MIVGAGCNELHVNVHAITRSLHASFEDIADAQLARDLRQIFGRAFVTHRRSSRDDSKSADLRERGDDFILNSLGEESAFLVGAQVFEWQYGDRFITRWRCGTRCD